MSELSFEHGVDLVSQQTQLKDGFARQIVNLDATLSGKLKRRTGTTLALNYTDSHSLWAVETGERGYFVSGTTLYSYDGTTATSLVTGVTPGFRVSYAEVNGDVYWSNGVQSGRLVGGLSNQTWGAVSLTGNMGQTYLSQVRGTIIRYYRGRIYAVDGSVIWATDPMDYMRVDTARGFLPLESEITMLEPVDDGLYVGTVERGVRFLAGMDFKDFKLNDGDSLVPVRGSGLNTDGEGFELSGRVAIWFTKRGWVLGGNGGSIKRLTDKTLALPDDYVESASIIREYDGMRQLMSFTRGGNADAASASDIVTSEVIRNGVLLV